MPATPITNAAPINDFAEALSTMAPFQDLSAAVRDSLYENSDKREYSAGQTVFSLGQYDGGEFFVVLHGKLRVSLVEAETGAIMIEEYGRGDIFGLEVALTDDKADLCSQLAVTAEEDLVLIAIEAASFRTLAAGRPSLMRNIAAFFAQQLATQRFKTSAMQTAPEQRIFAALLELVERDPVNGKWRIQKMPKHRELADRADVDEALTAGAVATLIQDGVAERDYPGLIINDMNRLNALAS